MADAPSPELQEDRRPLWFIVSTVIIAMLGIGLAWPILPKLVEEMTGQSIADSARTYGILVSGYALMQFLFGPLMGILSDRFGRRPVLLVSLVGLGVDYLILAFAPTVAWLLIGRLLGGTFGAVISTANAYIADITPKEKRAGAFGLLGAAFGIGFIFGPLIGGVLGEYDLRYPFFLASALAFANVAFGYFFVPESLPVEKRKQIVLSNANPFGALLHIVKYGGLIAIIAAMFLTNFSQRGLESIWVLFTDEKFGWNSAQAGYSLALVGATMAFVQGYAVGKIVPKFGERNVIYAGYVISAVAGIAFAFVTQGWMAYIVVVVHVIGWGAASPALQALASKAAPDNEQGLLQGTLSSVNQIAAILGPMVATLIFSKSLGGEGAWSTNPGLYFVFGTCLFIVALILLSWDKRRKKVAA